MEVMEVMEDDDSDECDGSGDAGWVTDDGVSRMMVQ